MSSITGGSYSNKQVFESSGTFTAPNTGLYFVTMCGGGGNSVVTGTEIWCGGGAGAVYKKGVFLSAGESYSVTVGGLGGDSEFGGYFSSMRLLAKGGAGGVRFKAGDGGSGDPDLAAPTGISGSAVNTRGAAGEINSFGVAATGSAGSCKDPSAGSVINDMVSSSAIRVAWQKAGFGSLTSTAMGGRCLLSPYGDGRDAGHNGGADILYGAVKLGLVVVEWG